MMYAVCRELGKFPHEVQNQMTTTDMIEFFLSRQIDEEESQAAAKAAEKDEEEM